MTAYPGRTQEFQAGQMAPAPIGIARTSALLPYMKSGNGMSNTDAARQTPMGQLPTTNGMSQSTYNSLYTGIPTQTGI